VRMAYTPIPAHAVSDDGTSSGTGAWSSTGSRPPSPPGRSRLRRRWWPRSSRRPRPLTTTRPPGPLPGRRPGHADDPRDRWAHHPRRGARPAHLGAGRRGRCARRPGRRAAGRARDRHDGRGPDPAVLGRRARLPRRRRDLVDPRGVGPAVWFQRRRSPAPSAAASTSTWPSRTTRPRRGSRRPSPRADGSSRTATPARGGSSPTPTATRPASAPGRTAEGVAGRRDEHDLVAEERPAHQAGRNGAGGRTDRHVDRLGGQQLEEAGGRLDAQLDLQVGGAGGEELDQPRRGVLGEQRAARDPQQPATLRGRRDLLPGAVLQAQHLDRSGRQT
jgi:hypothetical protein